MKKQAVLLAATLLATAAAFTQNEVELALVTSANPKGASRILFQPAGELEVVFWDNSHVQVEISVSGSGFSRQQLKALVPLGVFHVAVSVQGGEVAIAMPGQNKCATINGKKFSGSMKFRLSVPHYTEVVRPEAPVTAVVVR